MNNMNYEAIPLDTSKNWSDTSSKTLQIHHDKLYQGYVQKMVDIRNSLDQLIVNNQPLAGNQTLSEMRTLKDAEIFATNGVYLHEYYFQSQSPSLFGDDSTSCEFYKDIENQFGSFQRFKEYVTSVGMSVRGWVVVAFDLHMKKLMVYGSDAHHIGGVWNCVPLIVLDVYEHAYFIDFGSDRLSYIENFFKHLDLSFANSKYVKLKTI